MTRNPARDALTSALLHLLPGDEGPRTDALEQRAHLELVMWQRCTDDDTAAQFVAHYIGSGDQPLAWVAAVCLRAAVDAHEAREAARRDDAEWVRFRRAHGVGSI